MLYHHQRKEINNLKRFLIIFRKSSAFDETVKKRSSSSYAPVVSMTSSGLMRMEVRQMRTLINVTIKPV